MKFFRKRSATQPGKRNPASARGKRMKPHRLRKEAGWAELDHQEAISYWTKSQGAR